MVFRCDFTWVWQARFISTDEYKEHHLIALLAASTAMGGTVAGDLSQKVTSPYGIITQRSALALCHAPSVTIGTIRSTNTYLKTFYDGSGNPIYTAPFTEITFVRERVARGPTSSTFTVDVRGGLYNGVSYPTSVMEPQPISGERYLMALYFHPGDLTNSDWPKNQAIFGAVFTLDASATLDSNSDLKDELEAFCNG
jgi:hypothetical protein